jgi:hypothetical protein
MNLRMNEYAYRMWSDEFHRFDVQGIAIQSDGASRLSGILKADTPEALKLETRPQEPPFDVTIPVGLSDMDFHVVMTNMFYKLRNGESLVGLDYRPRSILMSMHAGVNWRGLLGFGLGFAALALIVGSRD